MVSNRVKEMPKRSPEFASIILLKGHLRRGKERTSRIVHQVQGQIRLAAVTQGVQPPDGGNTFLINPLSPLGAYIFFQVARHRSHQLDLMVPEELRQVFQPRFEEHREVSPNLNGITPFPEGHYKSDGNGG